ncbi:helix-turn-helix domain-containing protein [Bacillus sp. JJ634]
MKNLKNYPEILDVKQIQEILNIGRTQAYQLIASNEFHTVRIGKRIKISKAVFIRWLDGEKS